MASGEWPWITGIIRIEIRSRSKIKSRRFVCPLATGNWQLATGNWPTYLVRYGLMGHVGRFVSPTGDPSPRGLDRGQAVVVRTDRGLELGEVLLGLGDDHPGQNGHECMSDQQKIVRLAGPDDWRNHLQCQRLRIERFAVCRGILEEMDRGLELLDVEPLLDQTTTVLHVLGPPGLDLALLRAGVRSRTDFDVVFEPLGQETGSGQGATPAPASSSSCSGCQLRAGEGQLSVGSCQLAVGGRSSCSRSCS
ncbi:MAG: hypothetical protein ACP5XB_02355 [Isosphaeraceae bacterium]